MARKPTCEELERRIQELEKAASVARQGLKASQMEEQKFRAAFEGSNDAITLTTKEGTVLDCNQRALDLFGLESKNDFSEKRPADFSPPVQHDGRPSLETSRELIDKVFREGKAHRFEWLHQRKAGEIFSTDIILTPVKIGNQEVLQAIIRDITERKQAQEELESKYALLRIAGHTAKFGGYSVDLNKNIITWSDEVAEIHEMPLDYSPVVSEGIQFYAPEWQDKIKQVFRDCAEKGTPYDEEMEIITGTGKRIWVRTIGEAVKDVNGRIVKVRGGFQDIARLKRAEDKERKELMLRTTLLDNIPGCIALLLRKDTREIVASNRFAREIGAFPGLKCYKTCAKREDSCPFCLAPKMWTTGDMQSLEVEYNGRWYEGFWAPLAEDMYVHYIFDITRRKKGEAERERLLGQLQQAQRLESIVRLTGGVAHDFNNLLTSIIGNADLLREEFGHDSPYYDYIADIRDVGERAAGLIRRLLAFSRKQVFHIEVVDLNEVVGEMKNMLRRILGEDIELEIILAPEPGKVMADVGQIEQVIMNLAVNARDAMPAGGKLTIETADVELDEEYAKAHVAVTPGPYVMMAVSDTGCGMPPEVMSQIFEPFFTTKEESIGTGLGLPTVYGIVKQSGGNIWAYSEPGKGTCFKIYLPRLEKDVEKEKKKPKRRISPEGSETILVVEDEERIRKITDRILSGYGYRVLTAASGQEALDMAQGYGGPIHLLLTDVVMPGLSGKELAEKLKDLRPGIKVIFMSGYTDNAIVHHGVLDAGVNFIQKPFTPDILGDTVREVLG